MVQLDKERDYNDETDLFITAAIEDDDDHMSNFSDSDEDDNSHFIYKSQARHIETGKLHFYSDLFITQFSNIIQCTLLT